MAYSPPPGQQYYGPPNQQPFPPYGGFARPTNGFAIASLICGLTILVAGITFIPAIVCGHVARAQIRRTGERGGGMARAGLILGYIGGAIIVGLALLVVGAAVRAGNSNSVSHAVVLSFDKPIGGPEGKPFRAPPIGKAAPAVPMLPKQPLSAAP